MGQVSDTVVIFIVINRSYTQAHAQKRGLSNRGRDPKEV